MGAIDIVPTTAAIGAEISGVDLRKPLSSEAVDAIEQALLDHLVLIFRDQNITPEEQLAFARQFGKISIPPFGPVHGDNPEFMVLDQKSPKGEGADVWHSDNTFIEEPPLGSILKAVLLPSVGGDTCFASMYAAYEAFSPTMRDFLDGLTAVHDITLPLTRAIRDGHSTAKAEEMQAKWPPVVHPVVRTHPVTKRKGIYVNGNSTTRIVELSEAENAVVLPFLFEHTRSPEFQCRFRWDTNSVIFWDNRSVQHYAVPDYNERRVMARVTLEGDRPF